MVAITCGARACRANPLRKAACFPIEHGTEVDTSIKSNDQAENLMKARQ